MRILFITGDEYSAMSVEKDIGIVEAVKKTEANGGKLTISNDEYYAELSILEFKDVDIDFVDFIKSNFIDYDNSKNTDFHVI